ncbi:hypothetical protein [Pseudomonas sp. F(2018)]|uniref:hypothetical protein n=1 Tax=Pseudomonas sp. F(2018) TaxID=2502240 RepID=UPI0010F59E97|nr:hypothetical protein [Pseudomonas sp. F(2018)]
MPNHLAPRPISVWLFCLFLLAATTLFLAGIAELFLGNPTANLRIDSIIKLFELIFWLLIFPLTPLALLFGVYKRKKWGRWFGLVAITAFAVWLILGTKGATYSTDAGRVGSYAARYIFLPLLLAWWGYSFGFSNRALQYFSNPTK